LALKILSFSNPNERIKRIKSRLREIHAAHSKFDGIE